MPGGGGFELAFSLCEQPQTHALVRRPATGIGTFYTVAYCCVIGVNDSVTTFLSGIYPSSTYDKNNTFRTLVLLPSSGVEISSLDGPIR